jgi:hypothetical protein
MSTTILNFKKVEVVAESKEAAKHRLKRLYSISRAMQHRHLRTGRRSRTVS